MQMCDLRLGDSREVLKSLPDCSVDAVVTDPPYALVSIVKRYGSADAAPAKGDLYKRASAGFMGKSWDTGETAFDPAFWVEVLRVLKPGGHVLAFSGTRSVHRLVSAIEDAGFEIRDMIAWVYGSGFPKSHDVSKGIDKAAGHARATEYEPNYANATFGRGLGGGKHNAQSDPPVTDAARQWQGWGTALKPALEPITVARKPLIGTVAENVLAHGTGAINVDGCRVGTEDKLAGSRNPSSNTGTIYGVDKGGIYTQNTNGRWPANLIHDGSEEVLAGFPQSVARPVKPDSIGKSGSGEKRGMFGNGSIVQSGYYDTDTNAARFFYCAKASKRDREEGNNHPTVKPTDLMRYLCRLVTPPGGIVLDPFMGSGSTGKAAALEGFGFIGIEREAEYLEIARARIAAAREPAPKPVADADADQMPLF